MPPFYLTDLGSEYENVEAVQAIPLTHSMDNFVKLSFGDLHAEDASPALALQKMRAVLFQAFREDPQNGLSQYLRFRTSFLPASVV